MRGHGTSALVLNLALLSIGCGPYLRPTVRDVRAFTSPTPCGQGPYELKLKASGARWGESVQLEAYSSSRIDMRYEILVEDETVVRGNLDGFRVARTQTDRDGRSSLGLEESDAPFDNTSCSLSHVEAAIDARGTALSSGGEVVVRGPGPMGGEVGGEVDGAYEPELTVQTPTLQPASWSGEISAEQMQQRNWGVTRRVFHEWTNTDPDRASALPGDATIRVRVWGEVPNPLEGVTFVLTHRVREPTVSDDEYAAHLRQERVEAEQERAEAEQRARERPPSGPSRRQRRRAARAQRRAERAQERREFCQSHHEDTDCWGEGGYEGHLAREEARRLEAERIAAATIPRPDGPPPPPRAEAPPPKAGINARWVAGYWHWAGQWVWIAGRWDVPEADVLAQRTVHAPSAPPPPRAESVPAPPAAGLVWTAGYWQWDGTQFVWIAGHWDVAPSGGQWQAPRWQVEGSGAVFVPGRWQIQLR